MHAAFVSVREPCAYAIAVEFRIELVGSLQYDFRCSVPGLCEAATLPFAFSVW